MAAKQLVTVWSISVLIVLTLSTRLSAVSGQVTTTLYSPFLAPNGSQVCPDDNATAISSGQSLSSCAINCIVSHGGLGCIAFTYDNNTQNCGTFDKVPARFHYSTNCSTYQLTTKPLPNLWPEVNDSSCSFPFTFNGNLFYSCAHVVNDVSGVCDKYACVSNRTLASCLNATGFQARNSSTTVRLQTPFSANVTLPTVNNQWLVIQQRLNASVNFNQSWINYTLGFGSFSLDTSYWAGLELLYQMSSMYSYNRIRFEFYSMSLNGAGWYSAEYTFSVGPESTGYQLNISSFSGDTLDALTQPWNSINGAVFATYDYTKAANYPAMAIAQALGGGWWYPRGSSPVVASLNGNYTMPDGLPGTNTTTGMFWGCYVTSPFQLLLSQAMYQTPGPLQYSRIMISK